MESCCSISAPRQTDWDAVWGWPQPLENHTPEERCYIHLNNVANVVGYLFSSVVGLIRIIVNFYFLMSETDLFPDEKRYLQMQIGRGVIELCGFGPLLLIPDLIFHFNRICNTEEQDNGSYMRRVYDRRSTAGSYLVVS